MDNRITDSFEPITLSDIKEVETKYHFEFPEALRNLLLVHNGGSPDKMIFSKGTQDYVASDFMPIKSKKAKDLTIPATLDDIGDIIPNNVIPFVMDPFGNYIVFDKTDGNIYFLDMEDQSLVFLSDDFEKFMSSLKEDEE